MDNHQELRRVPHLTSMASLATSRFSKHLGWNNSNTPSTLTGCVSSLTNSKRTIGEETSDEPKLIPFC